MNNDGVVLKTQSYPFFEIFKFLFYREKQDNACSVAVFFMFFFSFLMFGNTFHFLFLVMAFILCFLIYIGYFISNICSIFQIQSRWEKYGFNAKKSMKLFEKENCLFIQNEYRLINLSNYLANDMISVINKKNKIIFFINYLNIFFIISKSELCYEKINYYLNSAKKNNQINSPDEYLYKEKISGLYYLLPFSKKNNLVMRFQQIGLFCVNMMLFYLYIKIATYFLRFSISTRQTNIAESEGLLLLFDAALAVYILCSPIYQSIKIHNQKKKGEKFFLLSFRPLNIFVKKDMVVMSNHIHYIEIPLHRDYIAKVIDSSKGHFLFYTKYGNFYINIPENDIEKTKEAYDLTLSYIERV